MQLSQHLTVTRAAGGSPKCLQHSAAVLSRTELTIVAFGGGASSKNVAHPKHEKFSRNMEAPLKRPWSSYQQRSCRLFAVG